MFFNVLVEQERSFASVETGQTLSSHLFATSQRRWPGSSNTETHTSLQSSSSSDGWRSQDDRSCPRQRCVVAAEEEEGVHLRAVVMSHVAIAAISAEGKTALAEGIGVRETSAVLPEVAEGVRLLRLRTQQMTAGRRHEMRVGDSRSTRSRMATVLAIGQGTTIGGRCSRGVSVITRGIRETSGHRLRPLQQQLLRRVRPALAALGGTCNPTICPAVLHPSPVAAAGTVLPPAALAVILGVIMMIVTAACGLEPVMMTAVVGVEGTGSSRTVDGVMIGEEGSADVALRMIRVDVVAIVSVNVNVNVNVSAMDGVTMTAVVAAAAVRMMAAGLPVGTIGVTAAVTTGGSGAVTATATAIVIAAEKENHHAKDRNEPADEMDQMLAVVEERGAATVAAAAVLALAAAAEEVVVVPMETGRGRMSCSPHISTRLSTSLRYMRRFNRMEEAVRARNERHTFHSCFGYVWFGLVWPGLVWSGLVWSRLVSSRLVSFCLVCICPYMPTQTESRY
eukprot:COSAG06_NODE_3619_length_5112_cov_13.003591_2_plen_508_part_00